MAFPDSWNAIHRLVIIAERLEKINTPLDGNGLGWIIKSAARREALSNAKTYVEDFLLKRLGEFGKVISVSGFIAKIKIRHLDVKIVITYPRNNPKIEEHVFNYSLIYEDQVNMPSWIPSNIKVHGEGLENCIKRLKELHGYMWPSY